MAEHNNETIGERIRRRRIEKGLSQIQVAEKSGVSMQAISLWEHGKTSPSASNITALAKALECEVQWLLEGGEYDENRVMSLIKGTNENKKIENKLENNNQIKGMQDSRLRDFISGKDIDDPSLAENLYNIARLFCDLDSSRRSEVLRFAIEQWKEAKDEELKKYESIYNKYR